MCENHNTKKKTRQEVIEEFKKIHGDLYDYSNFEYVNNLTKSDIKCKVCGTVFKQNRKQHIRGQGCPICGLHKNKHGNKKCRRDGTVRYTTETLKNKLREIFGDEYDLSLVEYKGQKTKIKLICPKHGIFEKSIGKIISTKRGCPFCWEEKKKTLYNSNTDEFVEKANKVFHGLYTYNNVNYINNRIKVLVTCQKHGDFLVSPQNHLRGRGCPICKAETNVYEMRLYNFLKTIFDEKDIERQAKFEWLTNNKSLDFYIPKYNIGIEHQGSQHFFLTRFNGESEEKLNRRIDNDKNKIQECKDNGVNLLFFTYELNKTPNNCFYELIFEENKLKEKILKIIKDEESNRN